MYIQYKYQYDIYIYMYNPRSYETSSLYGPNTSTMVSGGVFHMNGGRDSSTVNITYIVFFGVS